MNKQQTLCGVRSMLLQRSILRRLLRDRADLSGRTFPWLSSVQRQQQGCLPRYALARGGV
jgi:hypothetical protein